MPWEPEGDVKPVVANEIWSGLESVSTVDRRVQEPRPALKASVVFRTFGAESSLLQPQVQTWLRKLSAYCRLRRNMRMPLDRFTTRPPHWLEATRCGRPRFRETGITGRHSWRDAVTSDSLVRWWHTVSARLADWNVLSKAPHIGAQRQLLNIFKLLQKMHVSMPHATPKELTLGEYPDPDLEVSLIQQLEHFKRSLARMDVIDISEISWLGAVARMQAKTSTAMVGREQHTRFHDWVLSVSNLRAPRGIGIGKLHRHANSPNVARSLCQVSTEKRCAQVSPSALMDVREASWAKRLQRDTARSEAFVAELVSLRASAITEDVPLLEPVSVDKLDQTLRRIPDNTGLGSDCVEPGAFKHAPVGAKHELCHVFDCIIRNGVLPWGLLYVIIALLAKDGAALGGERPIGLLPIWVRILDRLFYDELSAWCDAARGFWDRATANSSALRSAIHSNIMMETAHILGIRIGILLIDTQICFDSVDLVLLMKACEVLGCPRIPLLLLVQAFLGPRTLRAEWACSKLTCRHRHVFWMA